MDMDERAAFREEMERLMQAVMDIGMELLIGTNGPMPLREFSERLAHSVSVRAVNDIGQLCDAIKHLLSEATHPRLRMITTSMPGVGYVYDLGNMETWPVVARQCHMR